MIGYVNERNHKYFSPLRRNSYFFGILLNIVVVGLTFHTYTNRNHVTVGLEIPIPDLMEMDQDGHDFART